MPFFRKHGGKILKEVGKGGVEVLKDLENNVDLASSLKRRGIQSVINLHKEATGEMNGSGYISRKRKAGSQLYSNAPAKRTKRTRTKKKTIKKKTKKKSVTRRRKISKKSKTSRRKRDAFD